MNFSTSTVSVVDEKVGEPDRIGHKKPRRLMKLTNVSIFITDVYPYANERHTNFYL